MVIWFKFLFMTVLMILFIFGEFLLTVLVMTASFPVVVWGHIKSFYMDTFSE